MSDSRLTEEEARALVPRSLDRLLDEGYEWVRSDEPEMGGWSLGHIEANSWAAFVLDDGTVNIRDWACES